MSSWWRRHSGTECVHHCLPFSIALDKALFYASAQFCWKQTQSCRKCLNCSGVGVFVCATKQGAAWRKRLGSFFVLVRLRESWKLHVGVEKGTYWGHWWKLAWRSPKEIIFSPCINIYIIQTQGKTGYHGDRLEVQRADFFSSLSLKAPSCCEHLQ